MKFEEIKRIYFLGIGGIGMSAIARYFLKEGKEIYGYDKTKTALTKTLVSEGMEIHYTDDVSLIPGNIDLIIYTPAIPKTNLEFQWFLERGATLYKRSEILGFISKEKKTIAIAGTHGKTTTCSITSFLLEANGLDISAFVGGIMKNYGTNYLHGKGDWIVVEADEYDRSFLRLHPDIAVILAMDADHLDIYGDRDSVTEGFKEFSFNIKEGGELWLEHSLLKHLDHAWEERLQNKNVSIYTFGIGAGEVSGEQLRVKNGKFEFDIEKGIRMENFSTNLPGRHNISNAVVAMAIGNQLGCSWDELKKALSEFKGIRRRFEKIFDDGEKVLIDDYAHHPEEIRAAVHAARELYPDRKITSVFQPHLFTRTRDFVDGFGEALSTLDEVILLDIYPARELPIAGITSEIILNKIEIEHKILTNKKELVNVLRSREIEVLMMLGAGDIDKEVMNVKQKIFDLV